VYCTGNRELQSITSVSSASVDSPKRLNTLFESPRTLRGVIGEQKMNEVGRRV